MDNSLFFSIPAWVYAIIIFFSILGINWLGFHYRKKLSVKKPEDVPENLGTLEGSLLGLMALILAFSFGMGSTKYEARRSVTVKEANAIGVGILRADLYPDSVRQAFRADFDKYIDARIDYYEANYRNAPRIAALKEAEEISGRMWKRATYYSHDPANLVRTQQMIPILNEIIDLVIEREALRQAKVPTVILLVLLLLTLVSSFMSGYSHKAKKRNLVMTMAFALMTTCTLYLVMELDRPQRGLINIDSAEQKIVDLKVLLHESK